VLLEVRVERQHHERQADIDEADENREGAEKQRDRPVTDPGERAVHRAGERRIGSEDDHPRVDADQEIAPERQDDGQQQQVPIAL